MFFGVVLAIPHLAEGARNFAGKGMDTIYERADFIKLYFIRPLSIVFLSMLLANAVRDSKRPENFIILMALASLVPVTAITVLVAALGVDLGTLQSHRGFLSSLGLHANEFGKLLAFAFGPMLYVSFATRGMRRIFYSLTTLAIVLGILLTFTRAAYIAIFLVTVIFLVQRRRIGTVIAIAALLPMLLLVAPDAFMKRITTGVDEGSVEGAQAGSMNDKLTAGRVGGYQLLLPEVSRSPLIGRGTGATAWSTAVSRGQYDATHPHNLYLEISLDIGLAGLALSLYFYRRLLDAMKRLSGRADFSDELKAFFKGSWAGFVGVLVLSFAGGHWYPHPEQSLMWISFGMCFSYWPWVDAQRRDERTGKIQRIAIAAQKKSAPSIVASGF
jgi:O-antigen ligase